jgi:hypothetical protein
LASRLPRRQFLGAARENAGHAGGDFAGHELESAAGRFVVEEDAAGGVHSVRLAVIAGEVKAGDFADAVGGAGLKAGEFVLRDLVDLAEHFAGAGEIEAALGARSPERGEHEMGAVDVGVQGGELVVEGVADEALRGEVVAFVGLHAGDGFVHAGVALDRAGLQVMRCRTGRRRERRCSGSSRATRRTMP